MFSTRQKKFRILFVSAIIIGAAFLFLICLVFLNFLLQIKPHQGTETISNEVFIDTEEQVLVESVLYEFFSKLSEKQYESASKFYAGDYEQLQDWNPFIDKNDHNSLWKNGCEINGLNCLPVGVVVSTQKTAAGEYISFVRFIFSDGHIFTQGSCCGADQRGPVQTDFSIRVKEIGGQFFVLDLPPYSP